MLDADLAAYQAFRVLTVHVDYSGWENRRRSAALIAERIAPWIAKGVTVFLASDLNARLGSSRHDRLEDAGRVFTLMKNAT